MISMPRAADANPDGAALRCLSAPQIGTVIDSSVFMRIDVAVAWRATISSSSSRNCRRSAGETRARARKREREGREDEKESSEWRCAATAASRCSSFRLDRDRFKATDALPDGVG